jgi:hypothetical protein
MLAFATGLVALKGVMDYAFRAFGVAGAGSFGADACGGTFFEHGIVAWGFYGLSRSLDWGLDSNGDRNFVSWLRILFFQLTEP